MRPHALPETTYQAETGCGNVYITITEKDERVQEVFVFLGKAGGCAAAQTGVIGRLASLALQSGADLSAVAKELLGASCIKTASCADAVGKVLKAHVPGHPKLKDLS